MISRSFQKRLTMVFMAMVFGPSVAAQDVAGSKLTFVMKNFPIKPALAKISDVSGNPTVFVGETKPEMELTDEERVTMEAKDEGYWDVILKLCERQKLKVVNPPANLKDCVTLDAGEAMGLYPRSLSGGSLVQIQRVKTFKRDNFRDEPSRILHLDMALRSEPKLGMFKVARQVNIEEATLDDGTSAINPAEVNTTFGDANSMSTHAVGVDLLNKPGAKLIKTLKGSIWMIRATKSEDWTLDPAKVDGKTFNCCDIDTVKVVKLAVEGNAILLDMEIESVSNAGDGLITKEYLFRELEYTFPGETVNFVRVIDAHLTKEETVNGKWIQKFRIRAYHPSGEPAETPTKATIRIPTQVKAVKVPFEFKDVELP